MENAAVRDAYVSKLAEEWKCLRRQEASVRGLEELRDVRPDDDMRVSGASATLGVVGVPDGLPLDRVIAIFDRLQYLHDIALWVRDPYAFVVKNLPSASHRWPRLSPRAEPGYRAETRKLHYGSDPLIEIAGGSAGVLITLIVLARLAYPYVDLFVSRDPRPSRAVRAAEDDARIAKLKADAEEDKERREAAARRRRDQREKHDRHSTLDGQYASDVAGRERIARAQMAAFTEQIIGIAESGTADEEVE